MRIAVLLIVILSVFISSNVFGQDKFFTKNGAIKFFSSTPMEDIEAINKGVAAVLDASTGEVQFSVLMKGFQFKKALMQEHFNENYVESHKYPHSEFRGKILNIPEINFNKNGAYPVKVKGRLTIHGVTKDLETPGTVTVKDGKIQAGAVFTILLADYKISIARVHRNNISKTIKITVDCLLEPVVQ
jgi:hypothetical protein